MMREQNEAPRPDLRGASTKKEGIGGNRDRSRSAFQDTPAPYCRCPRTGDLWQCAGRPELTNDPDGNRCTLSATVAASGSDHDPREELARALEEGGSGG